MQWLIGIGRGIFHHYRFIFVYNLLKIGVDGFKILKEKTVLYFNVEESFYHIKTLHKICLHCKRIAQFGRNKIGAFLEQLYQRKGNNGKISFVLCFVLLHFQCNGVGIILVAKLVIGINNFGKFMLDKIFNIHGEKLRYKYTEIKKPLLRVVFQNLILKVGIYLKINGVNSFFVKH